MGSLVMVSGVKSLTYSNTRLKLPEATTVKEAVLTRNGTAHWHHQVRTAPLPPGQRPEP